MCSLLRREWKGWMMGFICGIALSLLGLAATISQARSIRIEQFTTTVWFFIVVGTIVILLQLIPAALLFFSFIGTVYKNKKAQVEECGECGCSSCKEAK